MQDPNTLSDPLTQQDCDLRDFHFMPLDVATLRDCDLSATATGDEFRAAVLLWCAAWHQIPAASIPDNDAVLAKLAGYGRSVNDWLLVKDVALRSWVKCNDGRFYHPKVAEKANEAIISKRSILQQREADRQRKAIKASQSGLLAQSKLFHEDQLAMPSAGNGKFSAGKFIASDRMPNMENLASFAAEKIGKNVPDGNNEFSYGINVNSIGNNETVLSAGINETSGGNNEFSAGINIISDLHPMESILFPPELCSYIREDKIREELNSKASAATLQSQNPLARNGYSGAGQREAKTRSLPASENSEASPEDFVNQGSPEGGVKGKPGRRKKNNTVIPEHFAISDGVRDWADERGYGLLNEHFESFVLKCQAKSYVYADWDAAFKTAIRDDWANLRKPKSISSRSSVSPITIYEANKNPSEVKYKSGML